MWLVFKIKGWTASRCAQTSRALRSFRLIECVSSWIQVTSTHASCMRIPKNWVMLTTSLPKNAFMSELYQATLNMCMHVNDNLVISLTFRLIGDLQIECLDVRHMGNRGDGGWDVCLSPPYLPQQNNCLVYSFGLVNPLQFLSMQSEIHMHGLEDYYCCCLIL